MKLEDLKPSPFNPRTIDDASTKGLGTSIESFGDISGIVWNKSNGFLVTGHQRVAVLTEAGAKMHGSELLLGDKRFPVRVVEWNDATHKAAMSAANSQYIAGEFVATDLEDLVLELKDSDLAELVSPLRLDNFITPDFGPVSEEEQGRLDEKQPITCPECGHTFTP